MNLGKIKEQESGRLSRFKVKLGMSFLKVSLVIMIISLAMGVFVPAASSAQDWILPIDSQDKQKSTKDPAYLNFVEADLKDIIHAVSEITDENFIVAPSVKNVKITIQTTRAVPRSEIFGVFESILEVNGLAAVKAGSYYKIVRSKSANQLAVEIRQGRKRTEIAPGDRIITQVTAVRYISAKDLVAILKPMLSSSGNVVEYSKANALIITDTAFSVRKALKLVLMLDVNAFKRMSIALVPIVNVDSNKLYKELSEVLKTLGYGNDARQLNVMLVERLNSLIVSSANVKLLGSVKEWISRLDQVSSSDIGNQAPLHIYYVKNDKASNIKEILDKVFSEGMVLPLKSSDVKPVLQASLPKGKAISGGLGEKIEIHLYEPFNALIIHASNRDYGYVKEIIKELDRPSKQVLIDTLIVEVKLDETTKYGVQWSVLTGKFNLQQNTGIVSATISNPKIDITTPIGASAASGLMAFATDSKDFFGVIQALATDGKVNVLSNPHIMVKNYEKASISIGNDEPIATQNTQTSLTGTSSLIQNIEYRKTGILFTVTPQITEGGMVVMSLRQEVSDRSTDRTVGSGTFPSFTKREAETTIIAKDGETVVIGGLIQEKKDKTTSGVPLLKSIPILGHLFSYTTDTIGKTELIILLTPRIVSNPEQAVDIANELKEKLKSLKELLKKGGQGKK